MATALPSAATEFHFDMELFIAEIQSEQAIWNYTSESYKNRTEKIKAWEKICMKLYPNFTDMNDKEKNDIVTLLQRKWKSLRDSYNRELNKLKKVKSVDDAFSKRKYIYFDQLSFLQPLAEQRITMGQQEEKEVIKEELVDSIISDQVEAEIVEEMVAAQTPVPSQKKARTEVNGVEAVRSPRKSKKKKKNSVGVKHRDEDVLFCLSLVNDLKRLPELLRTDAKCEMLQVLKRYKMSAGTSLFQAAPQVYPPPPAHLPAYTDTSLLRLAQVEMGPTRKPRRTNCKYSPSSPSTSSSSTDNDSVIQQMF